MAVKVDAVKFRHELSRRGLKQAELAKLAKVDPNTVSSAARGNALQQKQFRRIALALAACPILDVDLVA